MNKDVKVLTRGNLKNFLFDKSAQYFGLPDMKFQFNIGDSIVLKSMATSEGRLKSAVPGFKRSLGKKFILFRSMIKSSASAGYDEGRLLDSRDRQRETFPRKIQSRKWVIGTGNTKVKTAVQLYQVQGLDEWFSLNELSPRAK